MKEVPSLRIPKRMGEKAILTIRKLDLINNLLSVKEESNFILIPFSREITREEAKVLTNELQGAEIIRGQFKNRDLSRPKTLHQALEKQLPPQLLKKLPRSMDIMGQVAVVELSPELNGYDKIIGEAVMGMNRNVKTVLAKAGAVAGEFRLRDLKVIAGSEDTETMYKENGCIYYLDPKKVYFSPRLSQERWRITLQVKNGEVVLDMFAGVGPFSIQIAKKHPTVKVYSVDVNPAAIYYLQRNITTNRVCNILPILGDAKDIVEKSLAGKADRVIMNLPERAMEFIDTGCKALRSEGGIVHYYGFEAEPNPLEKAEKKLIEATFKTGRIMKEILGSRIVRPTAPHEYQVVVDALLI